MWQLRNLLLVVLASLHTGHGCQMEGVTNWNVPVFLTILDVDRGSIFSRSTSNIVGITNVNYGQALNQGPYITPTISNSLFDLSTNTAFEEFEEYETTESITLTITFQCSASNPSTLTFIITVTDTNNNAPRFLPTDVYDFTIATPIPPGFLITGCLSNIIVRDIDLTTQRIEFKIQENPYFEIAADDNASAAPKEFHALIRTTTLIRALPEVVELTITATDVDLTGDPPISTTAIVRIQGDAEFELPEEPIFSQPFYLASYTDSQDVILQPLISLQQGYHPDVEFSLEGDYKDSFKLNIGTNELSLSVTNPLSNDVLREGRVILVVRAEREFTSGATSTIIVQLPEVLGLEFSQAQYEGLIVDNVLQPLEMTFEQGYQDGVSLNITGDHASFFTPTVQGNTITLTMSPLDASIINENSYISLQVTASNGYSSAQAIVTLRIIKDDVNSPRFEKSIYSGVYIPSDGLTLETILLIQGYDETVNFDIEGDHSTYFGITWDENNVSLNVSSLPTEVLTEQHLLLTLRATKPRFVDATTVLSIALPEARELCFEEPIYSGTLQDNDLALDAIILSAGYDADVNFTLAGDYASYFTTSNDENEITLLLSSPLPNSVIMENSFIILTLTASGTFAVTTSTTVLLKIIKQDLITPVFRQHIYRATYLGDNNIEMENISLIQGFDRNVRFSLNGEHEDLFSISGSTENNMVLTIQSPISEELINSEEFIALTILAEKALTVGANAAIIISLPRDEQNQTVLQFSQSSYMGRIENGDLAFPTISLLTENSNATLNLNGEHSAYFQLLRDDSNSITLQLNESLPANIIDDNSFITFELEASSAEALNGYTTLIIELIKTQIVPPIFEQAYYTGEYSARNGLLFEHSIRLIQGFDETVSFTLDGDDAQWFEPFYNGNNDLSLVLANGTLAELIDGPYLVFTVIANKTNSVPARATLIIDLSDLNTNQLRFSRNFYLGTVDNETIITDTIILEEGYRFDLNVTLSGDYEEYFQLTHNEGIFAIQLKSELPADVIEDNDIIVFSLEVESKGDLTHATIILELVKPETVPLVFDESYYLGSYSETTGLIFEPEISLVNGYDESVSFELEGDDAEWFEQVVTGNSISLIVPTPIPSEVLLNNRHLIFVIRAEKTGILARATIVIEVGEVSVDLTTLRFAQYSYLGSIADNEIDIESIILTEGYSDNVTYTLRGDLSSYFNVTNDGPNVSILINELSEEIVPDNRIILLELQAVAPQSISALAAIVFEVKSISPTAPVFERTYYEGQYSASNSLIFENTIRLSEGYDETVEFAVYGYGIQWIQPVISENSITFNLSDPIPQDILESNRQLILIATAQKPGAPTATTVIVITLIDEAQPEDGISFKKILFEGVIENGFVQHEIISVSGYDGTTVLIVGENSQLFKGSIVDGVVTVSSESLVNLPSDVNFVALELRVGSAGAVLILEVIQSVTPPENVNFEKTLYEGTINVEASIVEHESIIVSGYSGTSVQISGDHSELFNASIENGAVTIQGSRLDLLPSEVFFVAIEMTVVGSSALLVLTVNRNEPPPVITSFDKSLYEGTFANDIVEHENIFVTGYSGTDIQLVGEYSGSFEANIINGVVTVQKQTSSNLPTDVLFVALELRVGEASAILVLTIVRDDIPPGNVAFEKAVYEGTIEDSVVQHETIVVSGYDGTTVTTAGEYEEFFSASLSNGVITVQGLNLDNLPSDIPFVVVEIRVDTATAMLVLTVNRADPPSESISFDKQLYEGTIQDSSVEHETILVTGYTGTNIQVQGGFSDLFEATVSNGVVTIQGVALETLPTNVSFAALQLIVSDANAILVLTVIRTEIPVLPTVTFSSESYSVTIDVSQTGLIGRVSATSDNGEAVSYSLDLDDAHLQQRLSMDSEGGLLLSAPANSGSYSLRVVATSVVSQVTATAPVYLSVEAIVVCGDDLSVPPLIILDRDEEEPHQNLVIINTTQHPGCRYSMTNRWPLNQTWLYVDDTGLHTLPIDREDESIAFMALSQVQVELTLECDTDKSQTRNKRSLSPETRLEHLGPYDYGSNKWILTDTIQYNSRRSLVNLIVNDINDNAPIFIGKENEPIVVGYPIPELEERVLPRALVELEATDADVGENARLFYWSSEAALAVAPTTGSVHVRENAQLEDDMLLTVNVTDRNGVDGLTGSIQLRVKLVDTTHIAVITARGAFLDDERYVLSNLSAALGYEVKSLKSTVISDNMEFGRTELSSRKKRDLASALGPSLQLYVYGLIASEPVDVNQLTEDISSKVVTSVDVISNLSLGDYLDGLESCVVQTTTGLLVATIVLSVLLFLLIVAATVWFILKRRKKENYEQFSDENSLESPKVSVTLPPKVENIQKPRLNIEELKKSERRLQEMLDAPLPKEEITIEPIPSVSRVKSPENDFKLVLADSQAAIVIQSIDKLKTGDESEDEDEYGERVRSKRKSVVTFNENVEKIIHVEDTLDDPEDGPLENFEVYRF